jgi:hypothetical protein
VLGIVGFFHGFQLRKKKKLIEDIPTSTVRGMAMGLTEVKGKAGIFRGPLRSCFAKAECVFYHYKIEEYRSSGKSSRWVTIAEYWSPEYFCLEDGTGKVLVNPVGAECYLRTDRQYGTGMGGADKESFLQTLEGLGIKTAGFAGFGKTLRCSETYVMPGDDLYVLGTATENPFVTGSSRGCENICIQKESSSFFCISDESEKELLATMSGKMYLFLYGGPLLTVVCLFFLIGHYFKHMF